MIREIVQKLNEGAHPSAVELSHLSNLSRADVSEFRAAWTALAPERREAILRFAVQLVENDVELDFSTICDACLDDPDPTVRAAAIEGLWESEEFRIADRLTIILRQDPSKAVRVAAALSLARFALLAELGSLYAPSAARVREALFASARDFDESIDVRRRAIEAVGGFSDPEVGTLIDGAYAGSDLKLRASAIYAMGRNADERWLPSILKEMESELPELRYEAARAAGQLESPRAVVPLINLINDPDLEVRLVAVGALGDIGGDLARKALIQCSRHEDAAVRAAATDALGEIDLESDPLSISPFLNDSTRTI
jgi:HEAT repeat protein